MSAYFTTHHLSPRWTAARRASQEGSVPHPPPIATTITTPTLAPSKSSDADTSPSSPHRHLSLDTLARFLHDFHIHDRNSSDQVTHHDVVHPHFDLLENKSTYAIYGELPGLGREDVTVEVNDHLFTITISAHLKRLVPPTIPRADATAKVGVVHRDGGGDSAGAREPETGAATADAAGDGEPDKKVDPDLLWHVTERRVGPFRRAFQFPQYPVGVDMSAVSASMTNGLLCVLVPKKIKEGKTVEARRVEIA